MTEPWRELIETGRELTGDEVADSAMAFLESASTWTDYHVNDVGDGYEVICSTNDDNDDGYPDAEVATWTMTFDSLEQALKHTGKTRKGFYGQPVSVYVNGRPY